MRESEKSRRLVQAARRLRWVAWAGVLLAPLLTVAALANTWLGSTAPVQAEMDAGGLPLAWAGTLALAQAALVAAALWQLAQLLGQVRIERLFPLQGSRRFGRFAGLLLLAVLVNGVLAPLLGALLLASAHGQLRLSIDGADLLAVLVTLVLWLVARFLDAAARYEDDHHSII
ncbi:hypothetical protein [Stenotrophomonas indicatrix]|uniref:hypothetical protein n=1 Tax=Stenotrophomonas indicatrix TaxID=2045451 RepID=UPI0028AAAC20|nr:hypothetical protein [Stenotrophomonas indicatrix]